MLIGGSNTRTCPDMPKTPGKTRNFLGFARYFRVFPALDAGDRRGSLPGLPYCCSAGLTLATVVGEPHCCSVVTVNTSNTVQLLTLGNPKALSCGEFISRLRWLAKVFVLDGAGSADWGGRGCACFVEKQKRTSSGCCRVSSVRAGRAPRGEGEALRACGES